MQSVYQSTIWSLVTCFSRNVGDTHTEPKGGLAVIKLKSYFRATHSRHFLYGLKHNFMYDNIIFNNNVIMMLVNCTHALTLLI